jgi:hypothetical protein
MNNDKMLKITILPEEALYIRRAIKTRMKELQEEGMGANERERASLRQIAPLFDPSLCGRKSGL